MNHRLEYLKDLVGNNFLGIKFDEQFIEPYLDKMRQVVGQDSEIYIECQKKRDLGKYFLEVIGVNEYKEICDKIGIDKFINSLENLIDFEFTDLKFLGLGTATKGENRSYFIIVKSEQLSQVRSYYGLENQDFHITTGFKWKDVVGVRKNLVIENDSKFLQLLKSEFYKKENFNFVKNITNFDLDPDFEIIPISINENYLKILSGDWIMDIGITDENKFYIFTKYKKSGNERRLPMTEIYKILKQKK